jgi:hypothetical protein
MFLLNCNILLLLEVRDSWAGKLGSTEDWEGGESGPTNICNNWIYSSKIILTDQPEYEVPDFPSFLLRSKQIF